MVAQSYATTCLGCIVNATAAVKSYASATVDGNNDSDETILCPSCVIASLQSVRERHQLAKETWYESRTKSAEYFQHQRQDQADQSIAPTTTTTPTTTSNESTIRIYEQRYQHLRKELEALQQDCSRFTMETCALNVLIIERQESLSTSQDQYASQRRQILSQLQQSLCGNSSQTNVVTNIASGNEHTDESSANDITNVRQTCAGALIHSIEVAQATARTLRFHWSLQAFTMFRIQIDDEDMFRSAKNKEKGDGVEGTAGRRIRGNRDSSKVVVSGIGKICGLPLPHAGMELYGVLPFEELQSALRLVAQLTHVIARCFNIRLPHPIVIVPPQRQQPSSTISSDPMNHQRFASSSSATTNYQDGDIAELAHHSRQNTMQQVDGTYGSAPTATGIHHITASLTSLSSILSGGGIIEARSATPGPLPRFQHNQQQQLTLLSMDPKHVEKRIRHATAAIIAEDQSLTTFYALSTITPTTDATNDDTLQKYAGTNNVVNNKKQHSNIADNGPTALPQQLINDEFAIALQLLQNNILMICMNVGVPIDQLYPGEALLLNLYALQIYCSEYV